MSAKREGDVARLREAIVAFFQRHLVEAELFLPWSAQKLRGQIFATCTVLEERADAEARSCARGRARGHRRLREQLGEPAQSALAARPLQSRLKPIRGHPGAELGADRCPESQCVNGQRIDDCALFAAIRADVSYAGRPPRTAGRS